MKNIRSYSNKLISFVFSVVFLLGLSQNGIGQTMSPLGGVTPAGLLRGTENINLFNGGVNASIPLFSVGGRGNAGYTIFARTDSARWIADKIRYTYSCSDDTEPCHYWGVRAVIADTRDPVQATLEPGFDFGTVQWRSVATSLQGVSGLYYYERTHSTIVFKGQDGAEQTLYDEKTGGGANYFHPQNPNTEFNLNRERIFTAKDGSEMTFISDSDITDDNSVNSSDPMPVEVATYQVSGYLKLKNGTICRVIDSRIDWIQDSNGNRTTFTYNTPTGISRKLVKVTDSNEREINFTYSAQENQIIYTGFNGEIRTIKISRSTVGDKFRPSPSYSTGANLFPQLTGEFTGAPLSRDIISNITFPDLRKYEFYYNEYGELARIESPSGAAVEYSYGKGDDAPSPSYTSGQVGNVVVNSNSGGFMLYFYRRVKEKREYVNGGNSVSLKTTYAESNSLVVTETLKDPATDGVLAKTNHHFTGSPTLSLQATEPLDDLPDLNQNKEVITDQLDANGAVVFRTENIWSLGCGLRNTSNCGGEFSWAPYVKSTITRISSGTTGQYKISKKEFKTDTYNNITDIYEYDFGDGALESGSSGALLRRIHNDYVTNVNYTAATGTHIRGLRSENWVSSDAEGNNKLSYSEYEYDNYSADAIHAVLLDRQNISGHNPAFDMSYTFRGNLTKVTSYAKVNNVNGTTVKSEPVYSAAQFDIAGNIVKAIDGRNNAMTFDFDDRFGLPDAESRQNLAPNQLSGQKTYAFPTKITNALGYYTYTQIEYFTGAVVNSEDINGIVNAKYISGPLDRTVQTVTAINFPSLKKQTTTLYENNDRKITVTSDLKAYNDNLLKNESYSDGFGQVTEVWSYENGTYTVKKTEYDALGRAHKVSNPYASSLGESLKWNIKRFDTVGRIIETETPDGAKVLYSYKGNKKTVTDQASRKRSIITDGLGRVVQVIEDPNDSQQTNKLNYVTDYLFDAMGNARKIVQGAQTRYFTYDSLNRILRVKQVEQDANPALNLSNPDPITGNNSWSLGFSYDSVGNIITTTNARNVTTTGTYDALNRLISRDYSDSTPDVTYTFEDTNVTNLKGVLTQISSAVSKTKYTSFDELGRIKSSQQQTIDQFGNWLTYNFPDYSYDLSGNLISQTYPSNRVVTYATNNDNRLVRVASQKPNQVEKVYASDFHYTSFGQIDRLRLGNGRWENTEYDENRLTVEAIGLGGSSGNMSLLRLENSYGNAATNNGTLRQQKISFSAVAGGAEFSATQTYTYDALNRLETSAETPTGMQTFNWQQNFAYDRYGNRTTANTVIPNVSADLPKYSNPAVEASMNRLVEQQDTGDLDYDYDETGNLILDATGKRFAYDAENRMKSFGTGGSSVNGGSNIYDGRGRRVKKVIATQTGNLETIFVYDATGKLVSEFENVVPASNGTTKFITTDNLGSTRVITDQYGAVISRHDYMGYGEEVVAGIGGRTGINGQHYSENNIRQQFGTYERDTETELDYAQARFYKSKHARFTSVDPLLSSAALTNPQSFNRYAYALNSPYKFVDPLGLQPCDQGGADAADPEDGMEETPCVPTYSVEVTPQQDDAVVFTEDNFKYLETGKHFWKESYEWIYWFGVLPLVYNTTYTYVDPSDMATAESAKFVSDLANLYYNAMVDIAAIESNDVTEVQTTKKNATENVSGGTTGMDSSGGVKAEVKSENKSVSETSVQTKAETAAKRRQQLVRDVMQRRTEYYRALAATTGGQIPVNNAPGNNMASYITEQLDVLARTRAGEEYQRAQGVRPPIVNALRLRYAPYP